MYNKSNQIILGLILGMEEKTTEKSRGNLFLIFCSVLKQSFFFTNSDKVPKSFTFYQFHVQPYFFLLKSHVKALDHLLH